MSLRSVVAPTTRRATSAMQQRTTTDHAAMRTLGYDCAGNCLVDSDGDGTCDQDEVSGCQDDMACNYDANATDAGYCDLR